MINMLSLLKTDYFYNQMSKIDYSAHNDDWFLGSKCLVIFKGRKQRRPSTLHGKSWFFTEFVGFALDLDPHMPSVIWLDLLLTHAWITHYHSVVIQSQLFHTYTYQTFNPSNISISQLCFFLLKQHNQNYYNLCKFKPFKVS